MTDSRCTWQGNSDIYGLGIRIGLYLQWIATVIATAFVPDQMLGTTTANTVFVIFSVATLALCGAAADTPKADMAIVLNITPCPSTRCARCPGPGAFWSPVAPSSPNFRPSGSRSRSSWPTAWPPSTCDSGFAASTALRPRPAALPSRSSSRSWTWTDTRCGRYPGFSPVCCCISLSDAPPRWWLCCWSSSLRRRRIS